MVGIALLAEASAAGLKVLVGDDGRLIVRGPRSADELARRLLANKAAVLGALELNEQSGVGAVVCRCGSTECRDVAIHRGRSVRRDCVRCDRFIGFPVWYGMPAQIRRLRTSR